MGALTTFEERQAIVARFRRSGLTQREFCDTEGVSLGALRSWLYKPGRRRVEVQRFVEIKASTPRAELGEIEVHLGQVRVVLPSTIDDDRVVNLVTALERRMRSAK